jgi:hypothetical protein
MCVAKRSMVPILMNVVARYHTCLFLSWCEEVQRFGDVDLSHTNHYICFISPYLCCETISEFAIET